MNAKNCTEIAIVQENIGNIYGIRCSLNVNDMTKPKTRMKLGKRPDENGIRL